MPVPLFDCAVDVAGAAAMEAVLRSGQLAGGAHVAALEAALSERVGNRPVVALSDMTQALEIALRARNIGPGDEVLTLSYSCLSSNVALHRAGATPVWIDLDPATGTMDLAHARSSITGRTRAILAYHVAGYPADIAALRTLCDERNLVLIEDANNALGATAAGGVAVGSVGDFAVFSFYPNRQVNGIEGAALVCPDDETAALVRRLRRFGIEQTTFRDADGEIDPAADVPLLGLAATMPNVNAALARHNLALLDDRLACTRSNAHALAAALESVPGIEPVRPLPGATPAYWAFLMLCSDRDRVLRRLKASGVSCSKLHQPNHAYSGFAAAGRELPGTTRFMDSVLAVPCGWWVDAPERERIVHLIAEDR